MKYQKITRQAFVASVIYSLIFAPVASAQNRAGGRSFYDIESKTPPGSIRINLLGGVGAPGRYFVPAKTKLIDLLTIAGGVKENHDIENLRIKRISDDGYEIISVNLFDTLREAGSGPVYLKERDTVHIPARQPLIDKDASSIISVVTSILSLTLTGFVLQDRFSKK